MVQISIETDDKKLIKAIKALLDYSGASYSEENTEMSKEELETKIDLSLQQIKEGKSTRVNNKKELHSFLESL
jgi:hypothetical protein